MNPPVFFGRFVVYRRLTELFLPSILFSFLITFLNVSELVVKRNNVIIVIYAFTALFTILNFINLRKCYFDMRNKKLFFVLNFLSYAIFATVNLILFAFAPNTIYTWLFSITKGLTFLGVKTIYSVLLFHAVGLICIVASTIGMGWIFIENEDEDELDEQTFAND